MSALMNVYKRLPVKVVRGNGSWVYDASGQAYLDFYAGHAVSVTGHGHPRLVKALAEQVSRLLFYSNAVSIEHQEEAAAALIQALPPPLSKVFFVNSGAEAVENALKIARLVTGKRRIVAMTGGFHGRSLGALAATGLAKYRARSGLGAEVLADYQEFVAFGDQEALAQALSRDDVAAVITEPVQSLAGVVTAPAEYFQFLRQATQAAGALLIFDELQTGAGRAGDHFAFAPRYGVVPDLMTLGKGLGSGMPVAATVSTAAVAEGLGIGDLGTTFGGGPLASLAVLTTLEIIRDEGLAERASRIGTMLRSHLAGLPGLVSVRGLGLLLGLEVRAGAATWQRALLEQSVLVGTADDPSIVRLMPPLTTSDDEVGMFLERLTRVAKHLG